ncbi:sodium-dependent transporter [Fervidibacillus halotolerans]|uniref:Transporter n=1 Tax=Fervidibacillus halotolerans TaxID=2980027 RepID=A0A9E8LZY9_9BACI|nr:sodium-dependent transporter [Fervidibacillus halotolerans]WAA12487.1 sodium-dependent transporter [Fervidibacillus halotolerans]
MKEKEQWSSRFGFILAAAGSAIGLGAIWKFPYVAGMNGGGAFLFVFLFFTLFLGLPLLLAEFVIGRNTQSDAVSAYKMIAPGTKWHFLGYLGMATSFLLLSFYSVIGGWIIYYLFKTLTGSLSGLTPDQYSAVFEGAISNPGISITVHFLFMLLTIIVVANGVQKGIERASRVMMPVLFLLFIVLIIRSLTLPNVIQGLTFLFEPDFSKLTSGAILAALGQSFFTLSIGVSVMVTYSSYVPKEESLPKAALSIVFLNIFVVILAGLAIFPAVFSFGLQPNAGPVLLFQVLPNVFNHMPFGMLFFLAFILLFLFASLTSAFSMLELQVAILAKGDEHLRKKWAWIIGLSIFLLGIPSALSFGPLSDIHIFGKTFFDVADYLVSNVLMPLGAFFISIFVPLKMKKSVLFSELDSGNTIPLFLFNVWFYILRYVAPVAILLVLFDVLGIWDKIL